MNREPTTPSAPEPRVIDFHAHFMHRETYELVLSHSPATAFGARAMPCDAPAARDMFEPERQIADMDAWGIDMHVISSCEVLSSRLFAEPAEEARLTVPVNNMAADWVDRYPSRFIGSFALPLGDMSMAMTELERCTAMGLRVVNLPSNYRGVYMGDDRYDELWAEINGRGLVAFIHPHGIQDPWFQDYAMWNSIGQSIEEVRTMTSLIYQGKMDRHKGVKIVIAHGGGYMPHYMGRLDRNVKDKPETTKNITKMPSEYLSDFFYDSCVYDTKTLESLVDRVGVGRLLLGGDYPVANMSPLPFLERAKTLSDADRAMISGGTLSRLLELN